MVISKMTYYFNTLRVALQVDRSQKWYAFYLKYYVTQTKYATASTLNKDKKFHFFLLLKNIKFNDKNMLEND